MSGSAWYVRKRAELVRAWGGRCERCRSREHLHFAHVEPTGLSGAGRGYNHRVLDVIRNPSAYALLCRGCHADFDRGAFAVRGFWAPGHDPKRLPF